MRLIEISTSNGAKPLKRNGETKKPTGVKTEPVSLLNPIPAPTQPKGAGNKKGAPKEAESSDSDQDAPVAQQMLSFVIDDPDFESEDLETPKKKTQPSALLEDISDLSDDSFIPRAAPDPLKANALSFKSQRNDELDLFGLGIQEVAPKSKDSSEDQDDRESRPSTKEKKKKKKKSKEEDEKSSKRRHKQKKKEKEESGTGDEKEKEKKKKKQRTKKSSNVDDLESFLGGGDGPVKGEGGDYEEL